ncbi:MAG: rRNA maturation RNase YbeY [Quisquiliibacterium sp.]
MPMNATHVNRARAVAASVVNAPTPRLSLSIQSGSAALSLPVSRQRLRRWVTLALQTEARLTLRFVDSREGRALNAGYRGKDYATNVLTFNYPASPQSPGKSACVADIVICLPVVRREAREQRKPLDHHLAHLVIHGVLHAQGFEHEHDAEAEAMETLESALLRRLRIPDPYASEKPNKAAN